ncbi:MAG: alpha/beta fold hydrolase [Planctomycetota bacterium]
MLQATGQTNAKQRKRSRRRRAFWLGLPLALLALGLFVRSNSDELLFFWPSRAAFETPAAFDDVYFDSGDGTRLHGWFVRAADAEPGERRACIVQTHGNTGRLPDHASQTTWLADHGFHVLAFDYRDYGRSDKASGETREDLIADANAAIRYVASRDDVDTDRIGLHGFSLGSVMGLAAASESPEIKAVVAQAGFARWRQVANGHAPLLGNWLTRDGRDAVDSAAALDDRPLLVVHGDADWVVPVEHASVIADAAMAAGVETELVIVGGMGHNDGFNLEPEFTRPILEFFDAQLKEADARESDGPS